jgi:HEAT repeat protein
VRLAAALDQVRQAPFVVDVLRAAEHLSRTAESAPGPDAAELLSAAAHDTDDQLTAVAAVHALGQVFDDAADDVLTRLLSHEDAFRREHAAWVLGSRLPRLDAVEHLGDAVAAGGFTGVLAQRTLQQWAVSSGEHVASALADRRRRATDVAVRTRLVETLGLVPGTEVARDLRAVASDGAQAPAVRAAAVAALGDRDEDPGTTALLKTLAAGTDELAAVAELALGDIERTIRPPNRRAGAGVCVAQLFLHADIDRGLTRAGAS